MTKTTSGLELVLLRNLFYRDNYRRALFLLVLIILINLILAVLVLYQFSHPPQPLYFPVTADGRIIKLHPLSEPVVSDDFVLQWAADTTRQAFSLDFIHWREQLQGASSKFTSEGWKNFMDALKRSNNLETLTTLKMVSDAKITGSPEIREKAIVDGVYAWKVELPILVTYTNGQTSIPMPMMVDLIALRVPVTDNPDQIAINNFLPKLQQSPLTTGGI